MIWDWSYTWQILPAFGSALLVTFQALLGGYMMALILGLVWAVLRIAAPAGLALAVAVGVEFVRSTPLLVQLYALYFIGPRFGLALSPLLTGILGLGLHYSAYLAEVYRAGIEAVPRGQWEAASVLSFPTRTLWWRVIFPQAIPPMLPTLVNYAIAMLKETPLLSAIAVVELLQVAKQVGSQHFRYLEPMTLVGLIFLVLSLAIEAVSRSFFPGKKEVST
ncbi:MAG: ectoine/hydroxyectoine ABC transporter permease subunit EhuD [Acidobacteria bacterium]|nr:ectoine/hydroxyectoine ABC transporter permease subunit EhuD [Acidobacteriota bacterium]